MPFSIRPFRRFPVCCPVTYHAGLREGHGMVWNLSVNGWRLSSDVPLRIGQSFPMTVSLPDQGCVFVAAGIVRWARGVDYGVETLVANDAALQQVARFINQQAVNELAQLPGGSYDLNTPERDRLRRTVPRRLSCNPPGFLDPD